LPIADPKDIYIAHLESEIEFLKNLVSKNKLFIPDELENEVDIKDFKPIKKRLSNKQLNDKMREADKKRHEMRD
jgi:hypothetical protein